MIERTMPAVGIRERPVGGDSSKDEVVVLRSSVAMVEADGGGDGQSEHSVRISFAKTYPLAKRTSGGKPVQGHGSVALTNPAQGEFASKKCSNLF
jgi:hypothetical protein